MNTNKYSFRVFWSEADSGYVAICPELPGVSALGDSEAEALREAKAAMELYIEDVLESGEQLPEPQTAQEYSGQTRLRLSKSLHQLVATLAADEGVSQNQYMADAIAMRAGADRQGNRHIEEMRRLLKEQARWHYLELASLMDQQSTGGTAGRRIRAELVVEDYASTSSPVRARFGGSN
jgi:predicted RNase H-like HicB family nuclease